MKTNQYTSHYLTILMHILQYLTSVFVPPLLNNNKITNKNIKNDNLDVLMFHSSINELIIQWRYCPIVVTNMAFNTSVFSF